VCFGEPCDWWWNKWRFKKSETVATTHGADTLQRTYLASRRTNIGGKKYVKHVLSGQKKPFVTEKIRVVDITKQITRQG